VQGRCQPLFRAESPCRSRPWAPRPPGRMSPRRPACRTRHLGVRRHGVAVSPVCAWGAPCQGPFHPSPLAAALGERRKNLRSRLCAHTCSHPGERRWFHRLPGAVRLQAGYDRLRGVPRADSGVSNRKLAEPVAGSR
jgi:hypothetical protein